MKIMTYNKLVRDKIPDIIEADGKACVTEVLKDDRFLEMLDKKMEEELQEYYQSHDVEELADLLEVIYAAAASFGYNQEQMEEIRNRKVQKRGAFEKKLLLRSVTEK